MNVLAEDLPKMPKRRPAPAHIFLAGESAGAISCSHPFTFSRVCQVNFASSF